MENNLKKCKVFSDEIVEFSKLVDNIFEKIAKDIILLKTSDKPKEYDEKINNLERKLKKDIDVISKDINTVRGLLNTFIVKTNKKITKIDRNSEENKTDIFNLTVKIKKIENKLKIKENEL